MGEHLTQLASALIVSETQASAEVGNDALA